MKNSFYLVATSKHIFQQVSNYDKLTTSNVPHAQTLLFASEFRDISLNISKSSVESLEKH